MWCKETFYCKQRFCSLSKKRYINRLLYCIVLSIVSVFWDEISNGSAAYNSCSGTTQHFLDRNSSWHLALGNEQIVGGNLGHAPPENLEFMASKIAENASNFVYHW